MKLSKSQEAKVRRAINQHWKHKNSYFWKPFGNAANRRETELKNNWCVSFKHAGSEYSYQSDVTCSAKNYYYKGRFFVNGKKRTVRAFENLLGETK
jgi:hypothetical protein